MQMFHNFAVEHLRIALKFPWLKGHSPRWWAPGCGIAASRVGGIQGDTVKPVGKPIEDGGFKGKI